MLSACAAGTWVQRHSGGGQAEPKTLWRWAGRAKGIVEVGRQSQRHSGGGQAEPKALRRWAGRAKGTEQSKGLVAGGPGGTGASAQGHRVTSAFVLPGITRTPGATCTGPGSQAFVSLTAYGEGQCVCVCVCVRRWKRSLRPKQEQKSKRARAWKGAQGQAVQEHRGSGAEAHSHMATGTHVLADLGVKVRDGLAHVVGAARWWHRGRREGAAGGEREN